MIERLECLCIRVQDSFTDEILTLSFLTISDVLLDTPTLVLHPHDVPIAGKSSEDGNLVDLKLLQAHEEVVDVAVLALHDNLGQHSR